MASNASYPDVRSMTLVDLSCFVAYHLQISCCLCAVTFQSHTSSCRIELVAQRQHPASFKFDRSDLLWFALTLLLLSLIDSICYGLLLLLRVGVISARIGLANGLDDPAV